MDGVIVGLALVLGGAAELWLCWVGSQRRVRPNSWIGVRLPQTRRSDAAWYAAHEAAAGAFGLGGAIGAICGIGVFVNGLDVIGVGVAALGVVALLAGSSIATIFALRAASSVTDEPDGPDFSG